MFTVKFTSTDETDYKGASIWRVVSCSEYEVYNRNNGSYGITVNGVEHNVSQEDEHYCRCFIENSAGKTIATYVGGN